MEKLTNEKLLWALGRWFSSNHSPETKINLTHSGKSRPMSVYEIGGELARMAREIKEKKPAAGEKLPDKTHGGSWCDICNMPFEIIGNKRHCRNCHRVIS